MNGAFKCKGIQRNGNIFGLVDEGNRRIRVSYLKNEGKGRKFWT